MHTLFQVKIPLIYLILIQHYQYQFELRRWQAETREDVLDWSKVTIGGTFGPAKFTIGIFTPGAL